MPQVTLFDPRHSFLTWDAAQELSDATGLRPEALAVARPERLALHSVLIRVTSQLYVPDGPNYADLGISLRNMAAQIYEGFVVPNMDQVRAAYRDVRNRANARVGQLLDEHVYGAPAEHAPAPKGLLARVLRRPKATEPRPAPDPTERAHRVAASWRDSRNQDLDAASRRAIARVLGGALNQRGRLVLGRDVVASAAVGLVLNRLGSAAVGQVVQGLFAEGVAALGFRWLPSQQEPLVLNAKGASASGKSTIRFSQRGIVERAGYDWRDFAIISPDYWRKALIDYDGLGDDYKYAAMLCGHELEVIDRKLDILMAVKGDEGSVPHMLIDRFRFDSFQRDRTRAEDSTLLTRFGKKIYLFFLVTPPAATVERAWARGLETGRYKAVDDLLFHNVEAFTGMPDLFLAWAKRRGKWVQYEFLDNSVRKGEPPKTIAYGQNGELVIVDVFGFFDIDRFKEVCVEAKRPEDVSRPAVVGQDAGAFLRRAIAELSRVEILVPNGDAVFCRAEGGAVSLDMNLLPSGVPAEVFGRHTASPEPLGRIERKARVELVGV